MNVSASGGAYTADTTKYSGLTALNITPSASGAIVATAATTTDVTATATGAITVTGGKDVSTVNSAGAATISGSAGSIAATTSAQAAFNISVNGGTDVVIAATGQTTGTISVGATAQASGSVNVASAGDYTSGTDVYFRCYHSEGWNSRYGGRQHWYYGN